MKVNVVSRKLIKPHTPTPKNLIKYKISFKDELSPPMNVGVLLFYRSKPTGIHGRLEESLAKILGQFYPLAGRCINKEQLVDCSDQGAEFVEAQVVGIELTDQLVAEIDTNQLDDLLPRPSDRVDGAEDPLLSIQVTEFMSGGGLAISVSVSHRIFDGSSIGTFLAAWSKATSNPGGRITIIPSFDSPSLFPGKNLSYYPDSSEPSGSGDIPSPFAKRFIFNKEAITRLRSTLRPKDGNKALSRVRVVCALIAKALMGVDRAKHGETRPFLIAQAVNMRDRTIPPLPKHSCGNLVIQSVTECVAPTEDLGIQEIVCLMGDAIKKTISNCADILSLDESGRDSIIVNPEAYLIERSESDEANVMWFSDWTKFGFYEADFGWGKPVRASVGAFPAEKLAVLMNNDEDDGIEAWLHLNHNDMAYFQQDDDIKLFAT